MNNKVFSDRTDWPGAPNALETMLAGIRHSEDFINLAESNPTQCRFSFYNEKILTGFVNPESLRYCPDPKGAKAARAVVRDYYASRGVTLDPEQIFLVSGTSEAYTHVLKLMTDAGDKILVPRPSYPLFDMLLGLCDVQTENYDLTYGQSWSVDRETIIKKLAAAKGMVCVHPNNPTGHYVSPDEYNFLNAKLKGREEFFMISDEVFWDFAFESGKPAWSFAGKSDRLTFTMSGVSKILGLPQMKLSWVIVTGPEKLRQEAVRRLEILADTYLSVSTPIAESLAGWMQSENKIVSEIRGRVRNNYRWLSNECGNLAIKTLACEGGWYAVLKLPGGLNDEEAACTLLEEGRIYIHPGYYYDFPESDRLVASLLLPENEFREGIKRLFKVLKIKEFPVDPVRDRLPEI